MNENDFKELVGAFDIKYYNNKGAFSNGFTISDLNNIASSLKENSNLKSKYLNETGFQNSLISHFNSFKSFLILIFFFFFFFLKIFFIFF
jgi:hypothetical protein